VINRSIARRYAQALIELVEADAAQIAGKLGQFHKLVEANPALKEVLSSPAFRMEERRRVLDQVIKQLGWGHPLDRFLWYLVEHRRVALLEAIVETFTSMLDEREGKIRVRVESAKSLDSTEEASLKKALADGLKKQVVMEPTLDPSLLAGLRVRIGDLVVDGSLKTQLDSLKNVLTKQQA
jgi:F-type H+-transporting ATPase subunit delta